MEKEPPQRSSLLRTTCNSEGKCYQLVIDSWSTNNLVVFEVVENLKIKKLPHATPYKVSWLNKGQQVLVNEQCQVEFQTDGYTDKVLSDIIHMDVCHLLLGREWKYDRNVNHYGRKNTYWIEKEGVTYTLIPLKDEDKHQ